MFICVFEDDQASRFAPISDTRPVCDLRVGATTSLGLVRRSFPGAHIVVYCRPELAESAASSCDAVVNHIPDGVDVLFLNARWIVRPGGLVESLRGSLQAGRGRVFLSSDGEVLAATVPADQVRLLDGPTLSRQEFDKLDLDESPSTETLVSSLWDIIEHLPTQLADDFRHYSRGYNVYECTGAEVAKGATLINGEQIYMSAGSNVLAGAILDATAGPIILDAGASVQENAVLKGPAYVGRDSRIHIGAKMRNVAIGEVCKVGGEVHDVIIHGLSNKAHDGFLGHAYLGQWCNLGAATNNSNLRNDYGIVPAYDVRSGRFESTGRQFAGLLMGDHSKCSIGTMFNTGTTIGVCCNLFGAGFHPRMVPSFCWGGQDRYSTYRFEKAVHVAQITAARRNRDFGEMERELLKRVYDRSTTLREAFLANTSSFR